MFVPSTQTIILAIIGMLGLLLNCHCDELQLQAQQDWFW